MKVIQFVPTLDSGGDEQAVTKDGGVAESNSILQLKRIKASGKDNFFAFKLRVNKGLRGFI